MLNSIKNRDVDIYHFSNKGSCSWYEFAKIIFKTNNIDISVVSVNYSNYPSKINRPKFSVLSTSKIETKYGLNIQSWTDALKNHFEFVNK